MWGCSRVRGHTDEADKDGNGESRWVYGGCWLSSWTEHVSMAFLKVVRGGNGIWAGENDEVEEATTYGLTLSSDWFFSPFDIPHLQELALLVGLQ